MKKVLLIIPAYNEEKNILNTVNGIENLNLSNFKVDYIVVNDGSNDATEEICKSNNIEIVTLCSNLGIGGAVQTGYKIAHQGNYDYAIQFDGDGQHSASYISSLLEEIETKKCDIVIGSRFIDYNVSSFKSTFTRRIGIVFLSKLIQILSGIKICDVTSGFRITNRDVIDYFSKVYPTDYPEPETLVILHKKGFQINEVPVEMMERKSGKSSISAFKSIYYMIKVSITIIIVSITSKNMQRRIKNEL